ncbi:MAG: glucosyl-3-phosphoglycerate synthase [Solirubrobacterales bacterium]|nr:glucosyl-3-phosphoglycerate synthase [Solirubrobacterales bacterium]
MIRSFDHAEFPRERMLEGKRQTLTVVLPAREVADTVGEIVERILGLDGLVDQVLVVDADSADGTAAVARAAGAEVVSQAELGGVAGEAALPAARAFEALGPVDGKGDAMWRALAAVRGDLVAYIDADTRDFRPEFVNGLFGPLLCEPGVRFVKGSYRRPFTVDGREVPDGGGRVSQLTARPLLGAFYPPLGDLGQPLAGEIAAPRELLEQLPFATRYAVETAMLIDVLEREGAGAIAECDLGERRNQHQPLPALRPMAEQVLAVICERLRREGRLRDGGPEDGTVYRPPFAELAGAAAPARGVTA